MTTCDTNSTVDAFMTRDDPWREAFQALRPLILDCDLTEDFKWGKPCYSLDGQNVVLMHGFKDYCALLFMKGALMKDPAGILVQQTENVQAARQIRFTSAAEIKGMENMLKSYIHEAIAVEKSGAAVVKKTTAQFAVPEEFQVRLDSDAALKAAFEALTPGRQRGYLLYFGSAKQAKTREARVAAAIPRIFDGKGPDDD
jgi:uncharacterized protein YdeI (YjbR/CyaY-like superfamily)